MNAPLVSCILAGGSAEETIVESVMSVLAQSQTDLELIVMDDGSVEGTARLLAGIQDARLRVLREPVASASAASASAARNHGARMARGEYLAFLDPGDVWLPDKLCDQLHALEQSAETAVAYGWTDSVDTKRNRIASGDRPMYSGNIYRELLTQSGTSSVANTLVRRAAFLAVGGFDETLGAASDWDLCVRLASASSFAHIPKVGVRRRQRKGGVREQEEADFLAASRKAFAAAPEALRELELQSRAAYYREATARAARSWQWRETSRFGWTAARLQPREFAGYFAGPLAAFALVAVYVGLFVAFDFLMYPLRWDETHYWPTILQFSRQWPPDWKLLRSYSELNTPLLFLTVGGLESLLQGGPFVGRLINFSMSFAIACTVAFSGPWRRSIPAVAGLLAFPYYLQVSVFLYTDMMAAFFVFLGFWLYRREHHGWAALAMVLAIATRQYAVAFPAALALYEFLKGLRAEGFRIRWRWLAPLLAAATIGGWILLFGGLAPSGAFSNQLLLVPRVQSPSRHFDLDPRAPLHALAGLGMYFVIPEWILFSRKLQWRRLLSVKALGLAIALLCVFASSPKIKSHGLLGKIGQVTPEWLFVTFILYIPATLATIRFAHPNLALCLVLMQLATMLKAYPWDKYLLPLLVVLWYCKSVAPELLSPSTPQSPPQAGD